MGRPINFSDRAWVAVGDEANWERGFENGIWGLVPHLEHHWNKLQTGHLVLFYCVAPVKGFVGAGIVRSKFRQTAPYWKEELEAGDVIWPFRFEFDVTHLIPLLKWKQLAVSNKPFKTAILAGISPIKDRDVPHKILEALQFTKISPNHSSVSLSHTNLEFEPKSEFLGFLKTHDRRLFNSQEFPLHEFQRLPEKGDYSKGRKRF